MTPQNGPIVKHVQQQRSTTLRRSSVLVLATSLALSLGGCSQDETASFEAQASQSEEASADPSASTVESEGQQELEPAQGRTIEVNEALTHSGEREAFTVTVHRVAIHDYHVEAEVTIVNDGANQQKAWFGATNCCAPRLFDDRGRVYTFQIQPGGKNESVTLQGGEGVNAVLVFAGRVDSEATELTLDFTEILSDEDAWSLITFDVPIGAV